MCSTLLKYNFRVWDDLVFFGHTQEGLYMGFGIVFSDTDKSQYSFIFDFGVINLNVTYCSVDYWLLSPGKELAVC